MEKIDIASKLLFGILEFYNSVETGRRITYPDALEEELVKKMEELDGKRNKQDTKKKRKQSG